MGCSPTRLRPPKSRSSARCRLLGADQEPCFRYPIRRRRCVPRGTASGCARRCGAPASFWLGGLVAVGDGVTPVPQPPRLVVQARPLGSRAAPERDPGGPFSADSSFHSRPAPPLRFRTFATPAAARACAEDGPQASPALSFEPDKAERLRAHGDRQSRPPAAQADAPVSGEANLTCFWRIESHL
jgi:hypothetical protein